MSVAALQASFAAAESMARSVIPRTKAADPYAAYDNGFRYDDGAERAADQFAHFSGTFFSAARIITARFAEQPFMLARRTRRAPARSVANAVRNGFLPHGTIPAWLGATDRLELIDIHPLTRAMADPNLVMTSFNAKEMLSGSILATGNCYFVGLQSNREGRVWDLWPVPATWMTRDKARGRWTIKPPGTAEKGIEVDNSQVAHAYFADPSNPAKAISPLAMVARSVLVDEAIKGAQHSGFKNPIPKVALIAGDVMNESSFTDDPNRTSASRPVRLEPHQRRQIVTWFQQQFAGVAKYGLPMVLDALIRDIKVISHKPDEMAFLESASLTKEQIHAVLAVSELLQGKLEGVSRASGALAEQFFVDYSLNPLISLMSQAITMKLCPLFAMDGEELIGWIAPVVPRDTELIVEMAKLGRLTYSLRRNEMRAMISQLTGFRLPWVEGWDDVVMPQTLDEREPDSNLIAIGRLEPNNDGSNVDESNRRQLLLPASLNGRH